MCRRITCCAKDIRDDIHYPSDCLLMNLRLMVSQDCCRHCGRTQINKSLIAPPPPLPWVPGTGSRGATLISSRSTPTRIPHTATMTMRTRATPEDYR